MSDPPPAPLRRHLIVNALALAPAAVVLSVLVAVGALSLDAALPAMAAIAIATALLVRRWLADLSRFAAYASALARGAEPEAPRFAFSPGADALAETMAALDAGWRRQGATLAATEASAREILDGLPEPVLTVDRTRRVARANRAARALLGPVEAGRDLSAVLRQPALLEAVDAALPQRGVERVEVAVGSVELTLAGPPARHLQALVRRLPQAAPDGSYALVALHDITDLRLAERMRQDFVANASHELKTPLASLVGFIETLQGPARDDAAARERFLAIMGEQADRMRRLVGDLLMLSQIEQREHARPSGKVDVATVIAAVADTLRPVAERRGSSVRVEVEDDLPPVVGEMDELTTAIQNLADNAVKYGRAGEPVALVARRGAAAGEVSVEVRDRGDGIPAEHLPRLTERFYRVDSARSRAMGGTGLGLAIVKHIVQRHRGRLEIESRVGEGSTFRLRLPCDDSVHTAGGRMGAL